MQSEKSVLALNKPPFAIRFSIAPLALGALLLFLVQPLVAKTILPTHGGAAGVWSACLLFFQCGLLAGYFYAFLLSRLPFRLQAILHLALLIAALLTLPPSNFPLQTSHALAPELQILLGLTRSIGLPYLLLASTSPLISSWRGLQTVDRGVFRWFAISNLGSLLGLLSYPFLIEPFLQLAQQQFAWSAAYLTYLVFIAIVMAFHLRGRAGEEVKSNERPGGWGELPLTNSTTRDDPSRQFPPAALASTLLIVSLAACSTTLLAASTSQMSQSGVVVPFLWVLPLSLYLASFILCFNWPSLAHPAFWSRIYFASGYLAVALLFTGLLWSIPAQIAGYSIVVLAGSMACHAQIHSLRPNANKLTLYYLLIALGGALGGLFTGLAAPRLFTEYWEFHLAIAAAALLLGLCEVIRLLPKLRADSFARNILLPVTLLSVLFTCYLLYLHSQALLAQPIVERQRDFFGVVSVVDAPDQNLRFMLHGKTQHGCQPLSGTPSPASTLYFTESSGVAQALHHQRQRLNRPLQIGVIGLGTGSLLVHAKPGDRVAFYEISPAVIDLARRHFSYLRSHQGEVAISLGDGRQLLQKELAASGSKQFDLLIIDAFAGDALPMHLLTVEAIELYQSHLAENGLLAFHITNRYLDLAPVLSAAARQTDCRIAILENHPSAAFQSTFRWAILLPDSTPTNALPAWAQTPSPPTKEVAPWTDNFGSLWSALR